MSPLRVVGLTILAVLLLGIAGAWWYFYGPSTVAAARLVPADTLAFATIPNATSLAVGYETSHVKTLVEAPEAQPLIDHLSRLVGDKNLAVLKLLLPELSGQSFLAVTHFDASKPETLGLIAAMKPKPGLDRFDDFVAAVKVAYPDVLHDIATGNARLLGVDYQWLAAPSSKTRLCVARYHGWIAIAWGEASLQDWLERLQGKPASPSLAENADYKKSVERVGKDAQTLLYLDYRALILRMTEVVKAANPVEADFLAKKLQGLGSTAIGTRFEQGDIVDRFSILQTREAQLAGGLPASPCAFETLNFTGPHTLFYWGASLNWAQVWKTFQEEAAAGTPNFASVATALNDWAKSENLEVQKNIVDTIGSEYSLQVEWEDDAAYPDIGLFLKVEKPDDFKPTEAALVDTVRKLFATSAVINEFNAAGHTYATLKTVQPIPVSPTMTEDGPWFGIFLSDQHAVHSFARSADAGLLRNDDFNRRIGDRRAGALELAYCDTPHLIGHAYGAAMPYVSMGAMISPQLAGMVRNHWFPQNLNWLAPMGPWAFTATADDTGVTGYSISGVGNQAIFLTAGLGASVYGLEMAGILPHASYHTTPVPGPATPATPVTPVPPGAPASPTSADAPVVPPASTSTPTNSPTGTPAPPAPDAPPNPAAHVDLPPPTH